MDVMAEVGACCVAEVMGTELYTLTPDTVVASARRLAFDNGIDHLLVLDNGTLDRDRLPRGSANGAARTPSSASA